MLKRISKDSFLEIFKILWRFLNSFYLCAQGVFILKDTTTEIEYYMYYLSYHNAL